MRNLILHVTAALGLMGTQALAKDIQMHLTPNWEYVADTVMGGVSTGQIKSVEIDGRKATRLTGAVSLENNGGFVQMAFNLKPDGSTFDASEFTGIEITVRGNGEAYDLRLRTDELRRPWHSFRTEIIAEDKWKTLRIPFEKFEQHRTNVTFDPARLRRVGVLAIGRVFDADVAVSHVAFY